MRDTSARAAEDGVAVDFVSEVVAVVVSVAQFSRGDTSGRVIRRHHSCRPQSAVELRRCAVNCRRSSDETFKIVHVRCLNKFQIVNLMRLTSVFVFSVLALLEAIAKIGSRHTNVAAIVAVEVVLVGCRACRKLACQQHQLQLNPQVTHPQKTLVKYSWGILKILEENLQRLFKIYA